MSHEQITQAIEAHGGYVTASFVFKRPLQMIVKPRKPRGKKPSAVTKQLLAERIKARHAARVS